MQNGSAVFSSRAPWSARPHAGPPTMAALLARLMVRSAALLRWCAHEVMRQRRAAAIRNALAELDDRGLHDLALDASEIESVAAESTGRAPATRVRVVQARDDARGCA